MSPRDFFLAALVVYGIVLVGAFLFVNRASKYRRVPSSGSPPK